MLSYHMLISDRYGYTNRLEELGYHVFIHLEEESVFDSKLQCKDS